MALFIFFIKNLYKLIIFQILIESIILITNNGLLIKSVNAQANIKIDSGSPLYLLDVPPSKVTFKNINNTIILPCTPSEEDNILVNWFRNDEVIYPGRRLNDFQIYENGSLKLPPNDKSNGIYQCLANDTATLYGYGALLSYHIKVEYPVTKRNSSFTNQTNLIAAIGKPFLIKCPIISVPNANITWSFGNITITSKKIKDNRYIQLANGTLFIKNVTKNSAGKYMCTVKNDFAAKNRKFSWILNTIDNNKTSENLNKLVLPLQAKELFVSIGKKLIILCDTYLSENKIEWWFKSINSNDNIFEQKINNDSREIEIINASNENHAGYYKCTTGKDFQTFKVIVTKPPKILTPLFFYESSIAASVFFNCTVEGNPKPKITWYRNGIQLEDGYTININSNILRIYSLDLNDAGIYQCFANNIAGEAFSNGYIRLRNNIETIPERPFNVKCFPINYKKINITFDIDQPGLLTMINVYTARMGNSSVSDKWNANIPIALDSKTYIILDHDKAILQPFMLFLRGMVVTSFLKINKGNTEKTIDPSLMSHGIPCATQGLEIHHVFFQNGIFIWWAQLPKYSTVKYYIIQFLNNDINNDSTTNSATATKFANEIIGTTIPLNSYVNRNEIESKLIKIALIRHVQNKNTIMEEGGVLSLILPENCTGILIPNTSKITVRVIAITQENEDMVQDYRYLEWKKIEDISEGNEISIQILDVESRRINFHVESAYDIKCIKSCYRSIFEALFKEGTEVCRNITINKGSFSITDLKPKITYELHFEICETKLVIGSTNIFTKADPPGPVNNHKVIYTNSGYELSWEPPLNSNGKIESYLISWSYKNQTLNSTTPASINKFSFPNIDKNDKFNITIRVVGESGIGLPIYIDLHKLASNIILPENKSTMDQTLAIIVGILLSLICIITFIYIFVAHRKRLKNQPLSVNANLTTNTSEGIEMSLNNPGTTIIDVNNQNLQAIDFNLKNSKKQSDKSLNEIHEMQTLIPHQSSNTKKFPNGNAIYFQDNTDEQLNKNNCSNSNSAENILLINHNIDECPIKLCTSTPFPIRKKSDLNEYLIIQQKQQEQNQSPMIVLPKYKYNNNNNNNNNHKQNRKINKISSSPNFHNNDQTSTSTEINKLNGKFRNSSNDELINEIENNKHSNSSLDLKSLDMKLANSYEPKPEDNSIDSITNKFLSDNGKLKLIIDDNCDNKTYSEISPQTTTSNNDSKNNSNCTETTLLNFENENSTNNNPTINNHVNQNYNWNHKIPIIDPNG